MMREFRSREGTHRRSFAAIVVWLAVALAAVSLHVGCGRSAGEAPAASRPLTFASDVRPIIERRCVSCHQPGQAAPFALLTYDDVHRRAKRIAEVTQARLMPPWLPEGPLGTFIGDRRLTDDERETIQHWVRQGAPRGETAPSISVTRNAGWVLGEPDLVVDMPRAYVLAPGGHDVFRNFVFPIDDHAGAFVRAIEFRSGDTRAIHHAVIGVDRTRASRRRDGVDGSPGYGGMFTQGAQSPDGHFLGWTPGRGPIVSPDQLPWRLDRGSDLVVQLHLLPGESPQTIAPSLGLYFTDTPPARTPVMMRLGSKAIDIPSGAADYGIEDSYVLPVDVDLLSVYPHAHYLGRQMHAEARLPNGHRVPLLSIPQWDFHWQQDYRYAAPPVLPRGTVLHMRYTYDNSHRGAHASGHATARVLYGPESHDEMGDLWLQVLPRSTTDATTLRRSLDQREITINVAGGEMLIRRAPALAANHVFLGNAYVESGRFDDAVSVLREAVRLDSTSADAHNGLASALFLTGRRQESIAHFSKAAELDTGDDRLFFNLAGALIAVDRHADAEAAFRRAVAINPDFAEAHNNLGALLQARGRFAEAARHFERAIVGNPSYADAYNNLAAALAAQGRLREAVPHLRRAVELDPSNTAARENLSAVLATVGGR